MRNIDSIVIHCSDSDWGDVTDIDKWHKERGWDGCGYHYVITNGVTKAHADYKAEADGLIQNGRDVEKPGAHARGHNKRSVGICLIGKHTFTGKQMYDSLLTLVRMLMMSYSVPVEKVYGHTMLDGGKTCPNFDVTLLRAVL